VRARPAEAGPGAGPRVVALGGGHGLFASLSALRRVSDRLTAVVTVAVDGGSSGRLRRDLRVLPPGDLRMALAALCGDDDWGTTWSRVVQPRFGGRSELSGHAVGNLLIVALWELLGDTVEGLDWVARPGAAHGRRAAGHHRAGGRGGPGPAVRAEHGPGPGRLRHHRGPDPVDSAGADRAAGPPGGRRRGARGGLDGARARVVVHQRAAVPAGARPGRRDARHPGPPDRGPQPGAPGPGDRGLLAERHLEVLADHAPGLAVDVVLADRQSTADTGTAELEKAAGLLGARLVVRRMAMRDGTARHDPARLARAYAEIFEGE